jgi:acetylornithine/N-succinyldiaminopimelate aminotransferase
MPTYRRYPAEFVTGSGCRLIDSLGISYLDFAAGIAVSALGHAHPEIVTAIRDAAGGLLHVSNLYWTEPMVRLAERLTAVAGMERAFFCNSGAEAIETALKLARKSRPGRSRFVVFEQSFHGRTLGALSATAQPHYQSPFAPLVPGFRVLPFGDFEAADAGIDAGTAAVLVEVIQGEGGVRVAPSGWLAHLRAACDRAGALLIVDEVQTGLGRTGSFYAYQAEGVAPDAVATAKALAGGLPMGALLSRGDAAGAFAPGDHGSTFGGGPFVASVANAVLDVILARGFLDTVAARGRALGDALAGVAEKHPRLVRETRGRGLLRGIALGQPHARALVDLLLADGLLAVPAGDDVVRFSPPLVVTESEIAEAAARLDRALERFTETHVRSGTGNGSGTRPKEAG